MQDNNYEYNYYNPTRFYVHLPPTTDRTADLVDSEICLAFFCFFSSFSDSPPYLHTYM